MDEISPRHVKQFMIWLNLGPPSMTRQLRDRGGHESPCTQSIFHENHRFSPWQNKLIRVARDASATASRVARLAAVAKSHPEAGAAASCIARSAALVVSCVARSGLCGKCSARSRVYNDEASSCCPLPCTPILPYFCL